VDTDPDVERVRRYQRIYQSKSSVKFNLKVWLIQFRAHLNDLENVVPYLILALLYTLTNPSAATAGLLFKVYALARIGHTIVYAVFPIPQPARALSWGVAYLIQLYMAFKVVAYYC